METISTRESKRNHALSSARKSGISDAYLKGAEAVSAELAKKNLKAGLYYRKNNGEILPAFYEKTLERDIIPKSYLRAVSWPDVDVVYDQKLQTCFAKQGSFFLNCFQDSSNHEEPSLHFLQNGTEQNVIFTTWPYLINETKKRVLVEMWNSDLEEGYIENNDEEASLTMACLVVNSSVSPKVAEGNKSSINLNRFPICVYSFRDYDDAHYLGHISAPKESDD